MCIQVCFRLLVIVVVMSFMCEGGVGNYTVTIRVTPMVG